MDVIRFLHQKSFNPTLKLSYGKGQKAAGRRSFTGIAKWLQGIGQRAFMFIIGTWSFEPLKKVLTFMATAISCWQRFLLSVNAIAISK